MTCTSLPKVHEKVASSGSNIDSALIKQLIVEDLRAPYYKDLFLDQTNQKISQNDLCNSLLLEKLISDFASEFDCDLHEVKGVRVTI